MTTRFILLLLAITIMHCGMKYPMDSSTNARPPIPTTQSIIPLTRGAHWVYSYALRDTSGTIDASLRGVDLNLSIPQAYGRIGDSLVNLAGKYEPDEIEEYVYCYEWEELKKGLLVSHRGTDSLELRGLYIVGSYDHSTTTLLDTPYLWFAYPGKVGQTWRIPSGNGDSLFTTMELVSDTATFYFVNQDAVPIRFVTCYLYKETRDQSVAYHYYRPDIGGLGYKEYVKSRLQTTYILKEYQ